jgi:hypothetical protein
MFLKLCAMGSPRVDQSSVLHEVCRRKIVAPTAEAVYRAGKFWPENFGGIRIVGYTSL